MSSGELTGYQRLLVDQFFSITSSSLSEEEVCSLLTRSNWNLEIAIIDYYQTSPESQRDFITTYTESVQMSSNNQSIFQRMFSAFNGSTAPLLPGSYQEPESSPSKLHQFFNKFVYYAIVTVQFALILPILLVFKIIGIIAALLFERVAPVVNKLLGLRASSNTYYARKNLTNPTERSRRFIYEFDELINNKPLLDVISPPGNEDGIKASDSSLMEISRPNFLECSYTNALYLAKKEFRWLMIYLQSDEHEDKLQFIQQVLLNDQLLAFLKNNDILVWGGNLKESESYQVANNFDVSGFPFLGLIGLTSEDSSSSPRVSLVSKIQGVPFHFLKSDGTINTPKIINKFYKTYERLNPNLVTLRNEALAREASRNIRAQQDAAYQRSLAQDRRREQERQRQIELQREQERLAQQAEANKLKKLNWLRYQYEQFVQRESQLDMSDRRETSRVAIRLLNGKRVQHTFHRSFSVKDIYIYVECLINEVPENESLKAELPSSYEHKFIFKLISVMPRAELMAEETQSIGDNTLVYPSGNLVVEEIE